MLCMDANFRLNNRLRSSEEKDPGLGTGFSYFVEQEGYNKFILTHANQEEVRTPYPRPSLLSDVAR
jgi:hypothetical protein